MNKTFYILTLNQILDGSWVPSLNNHEFEYIFYGLQINDLKEKAKTIAKNLNKNVGVFTFNGEECYFTSNPGLRLSKKYVIDKRKQFM